MHKGLHVVAEQKLLAFACFVLCCVVSVIASLLITLSASAATGINERFMYQARLLNSQGATVPDGTYNMEFKIYQDGDGCISGGSSPCGGTLKWTETRTSTNRVTVKNGYFSVELGSVTAFGTSVNWNQDTLWLSINIGGTGGSPSWDGEMLSFRRLGATPYALNAKQLGGLDWSKFVQVAPSAAQIDSSTLSTLFLNKTGASGNILQLQKNGSDALVLGNGGILRLSGDTGTWDNALGGQFKVTTADTTGSALTLNNTSTGGHQYSLLSTGASALGGAGGLQFYDSTADAVRLRIHDNGNIGVGITTPVAKFHIDNGTATAATLKFTAGTTTGQTVSDGLDVGILSSGQGLINLRENQDMGFATNNTLAMTIQADGDIGIGTSAPANKLHIENGTAGAAIQITNGATSGLTSTDGAQLSIDSASNVYLTNWENAPLYLGTNGLVRITIDNAGNVVVGGADTTGALLVLDAKTNAGDPFGTSGGMYYNSNMGRFRCFEASVWRQCIPTELRVTADVSSTDATNWANITGLTASVNSGETYTFKCSLTYTTAVSTTAVQLAVNGPTATALDYGVYVSTTATTMHSSAQTAYDTVTNPATGGGTTRLTATVEGTVVPSAAGTFALRLRSEVASSAVTIKRGSFCVIQ